MQHLECTCMKSVVSDIVRLWMTATLSVPLSILSMFNNFVIVEIIFDILKYSLFILNKYSTSTSSHKFEICS